MNGKTTLTAPADTEEEMPLDQIVICSRMVLMTLTNVKLSIWTSASGASHVTHRGCGVDGLLDCR